MEVIFRKLGEGEKVGNTVYVIRIQPCNDTIGVIMCLEVALEFLDASPSLLLESEELGVIFAKTHKYSSEVFLGQLAMAKGNVSQGNKPPALQE